MPYFLFPAVSAPLKPYPKAQSLPPVKHQEAKRPSRFHGTSSWSDWVRSVLPSQRAERGGTLRNQGFWEAEESKRPGIQRPRRHVTDSWQSRTSKTHGPDHIVLWNTAKDLPGTQPAPASPRMSSNADPARPWSWFPTDEAEPCQPREGQGANAQPAPQHARPDKVTAATASQANAISRIERRLAQTRQTIEAWEEARRQRRDLKESGEYLGVQGISPATGQLDMFTRTVSEGDSTSPETQRKLGNLRNALRDARQLYKHPEAQSEKETKRIPESERDRLLRLEKDKQTPRNFSQRVRWRTQTKQWSRAQEPGLSPIAQSHADHDFGSRIPSKHQAAEEWPEPRASGRLVDLASPTGASISFQRVAEEQSRDSRVGSPSSTSTVIRTPKRQSLAHLTPSAWELFENGINFDDSEFSEPGQQLGMPTAMPASADATQRRAAQGPTGRSPDCVVVSQGETRHLHSSSTLQGAASNLGNLTERTHLGPGRQLGTAEVANLDPLTRVRGQKVNARGQLRKLMPPLVYFRTKKMDGSRNQPGTGEGEASPPALSSMANLGLLQKCQGQEPMRGNQGLQEPEVTPGTIGGSPPTVADRTRGQVPSMGSPGPEAWRMEPIKTHEDSEWVEQALKDLTDKSNQLMEEFASTRTTTTTGYDRLVSCSNQPEDGGANTRGTREAQRPVARRQVSRLLYNLASPSPSKQHDLGPPATSPSPKTSLSSGQTGQGTAADTTSTSPLADNAQPMEGSDVASFASAALEKQSSSGECSTLLTSMSTPTKCRGSSEGKSQEPGGQAMAAEMEEGAGAKASGEAKTDKQPLDRPIQTADDRGPTAREECEGEKQYVPNPPADGKGPRQTDGIEEDSEKQYVPNPSADGKGPRQTDGIEEDSEVPSPWMHMPGAFPAPPDIQVGRADGVEETSIGKADMDMEAKGEASGMRTNQCHTWVSGAMELLLLYWESIRPVLDTRSEYWERNAKHETTLADGLALALAMPVAILGAVALV